jgi:hypothetical protein
MAKKQARGSVKKGGRKRGTPASEHQCAVNRENASKPRGAVPDEIRAKLTEAKARLGDVVASKGIPHIVAIIDEGPTHDHFQWAMDFAADRGGLPKRRETEIDAAADLPPMTILFANHPKPAPGTD